MSQLLTTSAADAEALQVIFDPEKVSYRQLIEFFYKMHDPTTLNRQGPDVGTQYRSAIFYHDAEQEKIAKDITEKVQKEWWKNGKIATEILPAGEWWDAETYHQLYLDKNPGGYECPSQYVPVSIRGKTNTKISAASFENSPHCLLRMCLFRVKMKAIEWIPVPLSSVILSAFVSLRRSTVRFHQASTSCGDTRRPRSCDRCSQQSSQATAA